MPTLVLASSSPRRQKMFNDLNVNFTIDKPEIDESVLKNEKPLDYVCRVAKEKALEVLKRQKGKVILSADTTVAVGRHILCKPANKYEAKKMLELMSGRRHNVITAVCAIAEDGNIYETFTKSIVKFKPLSKKEIETHISIKDNWEGKAGGYGIQTTAGGVMIKTMSGSYTGVVGLPLPESINLLRKCNIGL